MGAGNSKPQTAEMVNPHPFQVTREVVQRLDQARETSEQSAICEQCKQQRSLTGDAPAATLLECQSKDVPQVEPVAWPWRKRAIELEEAQFEESVRRVNEIFGSQVKWSQDIEGEINEMEKQLTTCYKENAYETLQCEALAKQYHSFIFTNHFKAISKLEPKEPKPKSSRVPKELVMIEANQDSSSEAFLD